jgi:hypothetical protein
VLEVISLGPDPSRIATFQMRLEELEPGGRPLEYGQARRYFRQDPARQRAAYVAGCWLVLMPERGVQFRQGARILISSQCSS